MKYEEVYLKAYASVKEAKKSLGSWVCFYNEQQTHPSLQRKTPDEVYFKSAATYVAA
ncbi:MAG TPA: hypothetical protein ENK14_05065 [Caldithrix sp.]|nr:hypothetical protein [Caldithrix sp.]